MKQKPAEGGRRGPLGKALPETFAKLQLPHYNNSNHQINNHQIKYFLNPSLSVLATTNAQEALREPFMIAKA
jgi:hypothetical protein